MYKDYKDIRDLPSEANRTLREQIEAEAIAETGAGDDYEIRLLNACWTTGSDARRAIAYLDDTAWIFEVLNWETRQRKLIVTDETLNFSEENARAVFDTPQECEDWFTALGRILEEEGTC